MILVALVLVAALVVYALLLRSSSDRGASDEHFTSAEGAETSTALRALMRMGRPLAGTDLANPAEESPLYRAIRLRLAAAGNAFGGHVEVFLSTQIAATLVGATTLAAMIVVRPEGMLLFGGVIAGLAVIAWPYSKVNEAAKKRSAEINAALPEFAELLLMPLNSGFGILPALDFTSERLQGPVSAEVRHVIDAIRSRSMTEQEAFEMAGEQLGTVEAKSFFAVLSQAYHEGVRAVDTIRGQAQALRKTEHERLRERISKMENTIAVMTGIHLLPGLFIIILFPALLAMSGAV